MDKFVSPCLPPEGIERELLTILAEECCEVGQRVSKALRFGISEVQPEQDLTNAARIAGEIGDLIATVERLKERGMFTQREIDDARMSKHEKLDKFLQCQ